MQLTKSCIDEATAAPQDSASTLSTLTFCVGCSSTHHTTPILVHAWKVHPTSVCPGLRVHASKNKYLKSYPQALIIGYHHSFQRIRNASHFILCLMSKTSTPDPQMPLSAGQQQECLFLACGGVAVPGMPLPAASYMVWMIGVAGQRVAIPCQMPIFRSTPLTPQLFSKATKMTDWNLTEFLMLIM